VASKNEKRMLSTSPNPALTGKSPEIHRVRKAVTLLANQTEHVLILGEPGSGRTQVAKSIYAANKSKDKTFLTILCRTVVDDKTAQSSFSNWKIVQNP
jgi:transcriptional regulator with AAA-type ATPase domain